METSQNITVDSSQWEWAPCTYDFKQTTEDGRASFFNLAPSVALSDPKGGDKDPKVDIKIELEKNFIYSDELGWNWHKSWNIPNINVKIEVTEPDTNEKLPVPKELKVQIYSVKAMLEQLERFHLLDVGIKGENSKYAGENETYFSGLKFSSTSYNNDSVRFHLVVCVHIETEDADDPPQIIESFISPPIFVDSRKSARDAQKIKAKKVSSFIDPFLPENLDKSFVKRENRRKDCNPEPITNSLEGLVNYFTAPNIRHKVKHPLFLALKFSACISLYYNGNTFKLDQEENLIQNIQHQLYESQLDNSSKCTKPERAALILVLKNVNPSKNVKNKKVMEYLESIQNGALMIVYDSEIVPSNFREMSNIAEIKAKYKKIYLTLSYSKFKVFDSIAKGEAKINEDEMEEEDQEGEAEEDSKEICGTDNLKEVSIKKVQVEKRAMTSIPVNKEIPEKRVSKGGLVRPPISQFEKKRDKILKKDEDDSVLKNKTGNKESSESNQDNILSQLENMNRLLMMNAAIGIKGQRDQNKNVDVFDNLLQNQDELAKMSYDQIATFVQGFLGQSTNTTTQGQFSQRSQPNDVQQFMRQQQQGASNPFRNQMPGDFSQHYNPYEAFNPFKPPSFPGMYGPQSFHNRFFGNHFGMPGRFNPGNFKDFMPKQEFDYVPRPNFGTKDEFK